MTRRRVQPLQLSYILTPERRKEKIETYFRRHVSWDFSLGAINILSLLLALWVLTIVATYMAF